MDLLVINMDYKKIFEENLETLRDLLKINSIYDGNSVSLTTPDGKGAKDALLFMENLAKKDGFIVKEYDNQAISISYVEKDDKRIDIASHLDVVAVDDKWTVDPFGAVIKDGKLYGRGSEDMKTAAFLSYLCLKELRNKLSIYNSLRYNIDKYYRYYQAGRLEEKLSGQYDESSISEIGGYFETKDSSPVKKKCRKK